MSNHDFKVGGIYVNRKWAYEVLEIDEVGDSLVIQRLDTDEILSVGKRSQQLILDNIALEQREEILEQARRIERDVSGYGKKNRGFSGADFNSGIQGTSWRAKVTLAGAVALALTREDRKRAFYSNDIYPWNEAFLTHREALISASAEQRSHCAKFRLWLDTDSANYGFYVEHQPRQAGKPFDWERLMAALQMQPALHRIIAQAEAEHSAQLRLRTHENFDNAGELLPTTTALVERLDRFYDVPDDAWAGLLLYVTLSRDEAVSRGSAIAGEIAHFLAALLPLYDAAVAS